MSDPILAAFGMAPRKAPQRVNLREKALRDPKQAIEAHWRARLANQGQLSAYKPSAGERIESGLGGVLSKVVGEQMARRTAKRAMAPLNDLTPVGNVTGIDEGARMAGQGLTRGNLAQGALGAGLIALNVLPGAGGAKRKLGDLLRDEVGAIRAYHASPHDFDKFSMDKLGTGEGAQAYGKGLYFATDPNGPTIPHYRKMFGDRAKTYDVEIDAEPSDLMDWDAPGWEQPENVKSLLREVGMRTEAPTAQIRQTKLGRFTALNRWGESIGTFTDKAKAEAASLETLGGKDGGTGGLLYTKLGGNTYFPHLDDGSATQKLRAAGVKGARWRNASDDENLVIYDDSLLSILGKY